MKGKYRLQSFVRFRGWLFLGLMALISMSSCLEEEGYTPSGDTKKVTLTVSAPHTYATSPATAWESAIHTVDVLVFEAAADNPSVNASGVYDGSCTFLYHSQGDYTAGSGSTGTITFTPPIDPADNQVIVLLTNCRAGVLAHIPVNGSLKSAVTSSMILEDDQAMDATQLATDGLPMWGELSYVDSQVPGAKVTLARLLAKINITVDTNTVPSTTFELKEAYLYNPRKQGSLLSGTWDTSTPSEPTVTAPNVPATAYLAPGSYFTNNSPFIPVAPNVITDQIYTFESDNKAKAAGSLLDATCLVVGGYYKGDQTSMRYYRIDFKSRGAGGSSDVYYDLLRNWEYRVTITDVSVDGENTGDEAYRGSSRIIATVAPWNAASGDTQIGTAHLYVSNRYPITRLNGAEYSDSKSKVQIKTTHPDGWHFDTDAVTVATLAWAVPSISSGSANTEYQLSFTPQAVATPRIGEATIVSGNLKYKIHFTQSVVLSGSNIYYDASLGHLTFGGYGDVSKENYMGVYFKFGSLTGIAPTPAIYSTSTVTYPPSGGATSSSPAWADIPYTDSGNFIHDAGSIAAGKGDICKYLTEQGWAPAGNWRMPTSDELQFLFFTTLKDSFMVFSSNATPNDAGTNSIATGRGQMVNFTFPVFLPAAGYRDVDPYSSPVPGSIANQGTGEDYGYWGGIMSMSPGSDSTLRMMFMMYL